jgi:hypothetical protein
MKFHQFHNLVSEDYNVPVKERQSFLSLLRALKNDMTSPIFIVETKYGFHIKTDEEIHERIKSLTYGNNL